MSPRFGGGVVGDLAGFCAAVYQRGVEWSRRRRRWSPRSTRRTAARPASISPRPRTTSARTTCPPPWSPTPRPWARCRRVELAAGFVEVVKTALIGGGALWEQVRAIERLDPEGARRGRLRLRTGQARGGRRRRARRRAARGAQPRPHGRPRDRGGVGLSALPPRRGGRARAAGGAAPLAADDLHDEVEALWAATTPDRPRSRGRGRERARGARARQEARPNEGVGFVLLARPGRAVDRPAGRAQSVRLAIEELRRSSL